MKVTDYSKVAPRYDESDVRRRIPPDDFLHQHLYHEPRRPYFALDLACGTGNYLAVQTAAFAGQGVRWFGLDRSEAMLEIARTKAEGVELAVGRAEELPYEDGQFHYLVTSFAFHHFEDKPRAIAEMARVLMPGGGLRIVNIAPSHMRGFWLYDFFPEARHEDQKRFWSPDLVFGELETHGFEPRLRVDFERYRVRLADLLKDAERRDMSQLAILSEPQYERGLLRLREALAREPERRVLTEMALVVCTAIRPERA